MQFFTQIHRSITDPSYYLEILTFPVSKIVFYLLKLLLLAAFVASIVHTIRLVNHETGLPSVLPSLFKDIVIFEGKMEVVSETPYQLDLPYVVELYSQMYDLPYDMAGQMFQLSDSSIIIDKNREIVYDGQSTINLLLSEDSIFVNAKIKILSFPYTLWGMTKNRIQFTKEGVGRWVKRKSFSLFQYSLFLHLMYVFFRLVISIFFITIATYIFKLGRFAGFSVVMKISCFAVTPIVIENCISSLAGVKLYWTWQLSVFVATIVVYRAINHISSYKKKSIPGE